MYVCVCVCTREVATLSLSLSLASEYTAVSRPSLCQLIKLQSTLTLDATALLPLRFSIDAMRPSVSNPDLVNLGIEFFFLINLFYCTISFLFCVR